MKAAAIALVAGLLALLLKKNSPEMALLISIGAVAVLLCAALSAITGINDFINTLANAAGLSSDILAPVLKSVGIGIITKFSADLSRDAGQGAIASTVEFVGTVSAIYLALPLMKAVFNMINSLI